MKYKTVNALQENFLASESDLIVFSNGSKDENDELAVQEVRSFINNI